MAWTMEVCLGGGLQAGNFPQAGPWAEHSKIAALLQTSSGGGQTLRRAGRRLGPLQGSRPPCMARADISSPSQHLPAQCRLTSPCSALLSAPWSHPRGQPLAILVNQSPRLRWDELCREHSMRDV